MKSRLGGGISSTGFGVGTAFCFGTAEVLNVVGAGGRAGKAAIPVGRAAAEEVEAAVAAVFVALPATIVLQPLPEGATGAGA